MRRGRAVSAGAACDTLLLLLRSRFSAPLARCLQKGSSRHSLQTSHNAIQVLLRCHAPCTDRHETGEQGVILQSSFAPPLLFCMCVLVCSDTVSANRCMNEVLVGSRLIDTATQRSAAQRAHSVPLAPLPRTVATAQNRPRRARGTARRRNAAGTQTRPHSPPRQRPNPPKTRAAPKSTHTNK